MKKIALAFALATIFSSASSVYAVVWYADPAGAFNDPTVTKCVARSDQKAACKKCQKNYDGLCFFTGWGCAPVTANASCSCTLTLDSCAEKGSCTYY